MRVSVVMPAYNEERWLPVCLASLREQTLGDFELVVVDDGSTDRTAALAAGAGARVLRADHRGIGAARDIGGRAAVGDVLAFLDADEIYAPDYLERLAAPLADPMVTGTFPGGVEWHNAGDPNAAAWLEVHGFDPSAPVTRGRTHPYPRAVRRADFLAVGGYPHVGRGEDFAFGERMGPALVVPEARYRFTLPEGAGEIWRKSRGIGRGPGFAAVRPPLWRMTPPAWGVDAARAVARGRVRHAWVRLLYDAGSSLGWAERMVRPDLAWDP